MKIESVTVRNFRCFGPQKTKIDLDAGLTVLVGGNGSGKTALFQALSRLFGVTLAQRRIQRRDFHIALEETELKSGATLSIEVILAFPELEGAEGDTVTVAVPEYFRQMVASAPGEPLKARIKLRATWIDDGTPDGNIEEQARWIQTLDGKYKWEDATPVSPVERGAIQLVYVPATRDASSQVTFLLKGRLWQAAKWSKKFRKQTASHAEEIQKLFNAEEPTKFVTDRLTERWKALNAADTDTTPALRLVESRLDDLVRQAGFAFYPDEEGKERDLSELSDGQRSLFHIALTAATLEVESDIYAAPPDESAFDHEKLRRTHLTLLVIEEPENSLSPFFLSRIVGQARDIAGFDSAQVMLSSHSPAILSRIEASEVRYFRLDRKTRCSDVSEITLPSLTDREARQFVRLAVKAYPEIYFARFVILGEGDSERLVIPCIAEAMGVQLDPSFVPVVPLGGRHVEHFWKLLTNLEIPFATLSDLDLGRSHGGAETIRTLVKTLNSVGNDLSGNVSVDLGIVDPDELDKLRDDECTDGFKNLWFSTLRDEGIFLSDPLDLDFSMMCAFPDAYRKPNPGGSGPRREKEAIVENKAATLKSGGKPDLYTADYDEDFRWYPYLFLRRSKPEAHLSALATIKKKDLRENAPPELKALIEHVKKALGG